MSAKGLVWKMSASQLKRRDDVKRLWIEGKSGAQIAEELGLKSRNVVMGIVYRDGIRRRQPKPTAPPPAKPVFVADPIAQLAAVSTRSDAAIEGGPLCDAPLPDTRHQCKYIYGNSPDWKACGRPISTGVYCEGHNAICYRYEPSRYEKRASER